MSTHTPDMRIKAVFAQGWYDGFLGLAPDTALECCAMYPELTQVEIAVYLNGVEDGKANERFRLDYEEAK